MDRVETESERLTADIALKDNTSTVTETQQRLLDFLRSVKLKYMKLGHGGYSWNSLASVIMFVLILPLSVPTLVQLTGLRQNRIRSYSQVIMNILIHAALQLPISTTLCFLFWTKRSRPVYLVDFSCFKPGDDELKVSQDRVVTVAERLGFSDDAKRFMKLIISRACIGEESYLPRALLSVPPDRSFGAVFAEAEEAMFSSLDSLFGKTSLKHKYKDIGILIVNCSLIHPVPSLTSMIVNHYKLRTDIKTYNLGGMGCSAGLISIDLAKNLLEANPNSYAVVVSVEIIGGSWYGGNDKSKLIPNCLFRWGASAVLLSNLSSDRARSKYELAHSIRTHTGSIEEHFNCVRQAKDGDGIVGITLSKNLMSVAGDALKTNITTLAPLVLPWTEQLKFFLTLVRRKVFKASNVKAYVPDFKLAFKHFCIHPGGKAVMDAIEEKLALDKLDIEPSRMTLHRFGNTSSSSVWYVLAYVEAKGRVKRGDRVWQVALGSGYKCVSVVWKALEDIPADDLRGNAWIDSVHKYPVKLDVA